jgi:mannose-1-phosphate guanylyltransferase
MRAMVLSAGLGLRMRPLTYETPKPAIPVLGRPILVQILLRLGRFDVTRAVVNVHHLPDVVERLCASTPGLPETSISREPVLLGTGGGLRQAGPTLRGAGPIVVHNGDCLSDIDFGAVVEHHVRSGKLATLVVVPMRPGYGALEIGEGDAVLSLSGAPAVPAERVRARRVFTGCHVIDEAVLDLIPGPAPSCIVTDVYRKLAAEGRLGSFLHPGYWWEFGEPDVYLEGSLGLIDLDRDSRERIAECDPVGSFPDGRAALGSLASIEKRARLRGRVAIGRQSLIEAHAAIEDSVLLDGVQVGPRAKLSRVVVGSGTKLPEGFELQDAVVCRDPGVDLVEGISRSGENLVRALRVGRAPA